jgi:membrane-bound metal-dependent hydrolase YbcI (DUF457 family)
MPIRVNRVRELSDSSLNSNTWSASIMLLWSLSAALARISVGVLSSWGMRPLGRKEERCRKSMWFASIRSSR